MSARTAIGPTSWSITPGFDQAELLEGHQPLLVGSARVARDADGTPQHPGDMAARFERSLDNRHAVPAAADMTPANVVRLNFSTTDLGELFAPVHRVNDRFGNSRCAATVLGVAPLAAPGFVVMLEPAAVD
jgi:hypothetical protein